MFIKIQNYIYITICFMSIPNVYPGPLRSVKQPGKAKTAQFLQKWGFIRKATFYKNPKFYILIYVYIYKYYLIYIYIYMLQAMGHPRISICIYIYMYIKYRTWSWSHHNWVANQCQYDKNLGMSEWSLNLMLK